MSRTSLETAEGYVRGMDKKRALLVVVFLVLLAVLARKVRDV